MGSKFKPWQDKKPKNRSRVARSMIENGTGKGGPMRDRRDRRSKENQYPERIEDEDESFYDDNS